MFELCKSLRFEAAHTLERAVETDSSRRIHGHSYRAEVAVRGTPDPRSGMIIDAALFEAALAKAQDGLDHRFLDDVADLGPATLENLAAWIWRVLAPGVAGLARVTVFRDSRDESCSYFGPGA